ncbi:hypothetical protein RvY_05607 [Ramazzottius varieornatus]|uniref:Uncharacterized protein n=1 Tax=Ramazzottius varieornatus TaxID=947166 RepID=A0A1D1UW54_RAMVA|nr:hypothetical protein RvY_05607 [Ramazzottius varieornatus]
MSLMNEIAVTPANQATLFLEPRQITTSFLIDNGSTIQEVLSTALPSTTLSSNPDPLPAGFLSTNTTSVTSTNTDTQMYVGSPAVYGWLVAITVLLIITLLILLAHCLLHLRRRNRKGRYSPRQIPEFLATETTRKHPDYAAARPHPMRNSAKLTGYFYNPDYPLRSLTPGLNGRRESSTVRETDRQRMEFAVNDEEAFDRGQLPETRRPLDLTQEPAPSGALPSRLSHYHTPGPATNRPVQTISGGIVNENFVE